MPRPISQNADDEIRVLNGLIAATIDSADRYREAIDHVEGDRSRAILLECADQRDDIVVRLHKHIWERGTPPENDHSARVKSCSVIPGSPTKAILSELERGDASCQAQFVSAMDDASASPATMAIIRECYATLQESEAQMRALKRNEKPLSIAHPS